MSKCKPRAKLKSHSNTPTKVIKTYKKPTKTSQNAPQILLNSKEMRALQKSWYAKLAKSGFKDLEKFIGEDYQAADLLHGPSLRNAANMYSKHKLHYYRLWSCFLAHNNKRLTPRDRCIAVLHAKGTKLRDIARCLAERNFKNASLSSVFKDVKRLDKRILNWNKCSQYGLDFEADV